MVSADNHIGFFQMREMLHGESFLETLLMPVRIFFQGQDNSIRYFDGVLNPILIILSPFSFMNKSLFRDKLFFISLVDIAELAHCVLLVLPAFARMDAN